MDVKQEANPELDWMNHNKEVWLVKVPLSVAQAWQDTDFDEELGTISLVRSATDPNKTNVTLRRIEEPNKAYNMEARPVHRQTQVIGEGSKLSIEGKVVQSYDLRIPAPRAAPAARSTGPSMSIMSIDDVKRQDLNSQPDPGISMAWASTRKIDAKGVADKFVARAKTEVVEDLLRLFSEQDRYTFDEINAHVKQPKSYLQGILDEHTTTDTEANRKYYRLRPEYQTSRSKPDISMTQ